MLAEGEGAEGKDEDDEGDREAEDGGHREEGEHGSGCMRSEAELYVAIVRPSQKGRTIAKSGIATN